MNPVQNQITAFYEQMTRTTEPADRQTIKQDRQAYYDQLSETDKAIAREAARPYLQQLVSDIETDPALPQLDALLSRINALVQTQ